MSNFTFEIENRTYKYETYEWDNTWIDHPNDDIRRILYIGDSIACGARYAATGKADGKMVFDLFGTSRAVDNPYFRNALTVFSKQQGRRDAIIFNNGLHGWHLEDETEYRNHYENMIKYLLSSFEGTPIAIILTTFTKRENDEIRIRERNKVAIEIAEKYNLPVIDLFSVSENAKELLADDGIHFTIEGYHLLADEIVKATLQIIIDD